MIFYEAHADRQAEHVLPQPSNVDIHVARSHEPMRRSDREEELIAKTIWLQRVTISAEVFLAIAWLWAVILQSGRTILPSQ